jgi:hypothetical protein
MPRLIIYYFGPDGAGDVQANIDSLARGSSRIPTASRQKSAARFEREVAGRDATVVSVTPQSARARMPRRPGPVSKKSKR